MDLKIKLPAKVDLPVLLIFFTRPETFKKVFAAVKEARPSKLFLACDGPRENHFDDFEKIAACKKIAEDIDWECEVITNYSETNIGCGMRPQTAITWALSFVDRIVVLEDDCVPEQTFFPYMAELLEKYKDDERIGMVSGLNHFVNWDCGGESYFFCNEGAIWGWGTWARVWKDYDYTMRAIEDPRVQRLLSGEIFFRRSKKKRIKHWLQTRKKLSQNANISYWDAQFDYLRYSNRYLSIVPRTNLICNIGIGNDSTHAKIGATDLVWKKNMVHFMPTSPIEIPLKHPDFILCDHTYDRKESAILRYPNPLLYNYKRATRIIKRVFKKFFRFR